MYGYVVSVGVWGGWVFGLGGGGGGPIVRFARSVSGLRVVVCDCCIARKESCRGFVCSRLGLDRQDKVNDGIGAKE